MLEATTNAVSKANVERENGTFKNRLIAELRHENITDVDRAIEYINKVFIPKINKKFSYNINEENSMMKQNDYTYDDLNLIISERYTRIIDNASSIEEEQIINVPKQKYVLPANHPWRKDMKKFFNNN